MGVRWEAFECREKVIARGRFDNELPGITLSTLFVKGRHRNGNGDMREIFENIIVIINVF